MLQLFILVPVAYLAGSINFPIILFRLTGRSDPRASFSGNPGTTNVYRQAGPAWAVLILLLDFGRAIGTAWMAGTLLSGALVPWVGLALILGNRYPCFHGFKGGKGVANFLGFFAMLAGLSTVFALLAWVIGFGLIRKPFIASFFLVSVLGFLVVRTCENSPVAIAGTVTTVAFVIYNHRQNVIELLQIEKTK